MLEIQIQNAIFRDLKKKYNYVLKEVPVFSRSIDLVYVNEFEEVISVEVKINDWRMAVKQAKDHQLVTDRAYICLPHKKRGVSKNLLSFLEGTGIGLLVFQRRSGEVCLQEIRRADKNYSCWRPSREQLERLLYAY